MNMSYDGLAKAQEKLVNEYYLFDEEHKNDHSLRRALRRAIEEYFQSFWQPPPRITKKLIESSDSSCLVYARHARSGQELVLTCYPSEWGVWRHIGTGLTLEEMGWVDIAWQYFIVPPKPRIKDFETKS